MIKPVQASSSGGLSIGGVERSTTSDAGYWIYNATWQIRTDDQLVFLRAMQGDTQGRSAVHFMPIYDLWRQPNQYGKARVGFLGYPKNTTHGDSTLFSDGTGYVTTYIHANVSVAAPARSTTLVWTTLAPEPTPQPSYFSIGDRLYHINRISRVGNVITANIYPPLRVAAAVGDRLEFDYPRGMFYNADEASDEVQIQPFLGQVFSMKLREYVLKDPRIG